MGGANEPFAREKDPFVEGLRSWAIVLRVCGFAYIAASGDIATRKNPKR